MRRAYRKQFYETLNENPELREDEKIVKNLAEELEKELFNELPESQNQYREKGDLITRIIAVLRSRPLTSRCVKERKILLWDLCDDMDFSDAAGKIEKKEAQLAKKQNLDNQKRKNANRLNILLQPINEENKEEPNALTKLVMEEHQNLNSFNQTSKDDDQDSLESFEAGEKGRVFSSDEEDAQYIKTKGEKSEKINEDTPYNPAGELYQTNQGKAIQGPPKGEIIANLLLCFMIQLILKGKKSQKCQLNLLQREVFLEFGMVQCRMGK